MWWGGCALSLDVKILSICGSHWQVAATIWPRVKTGVGEQQATPQKTRAGHMAQPGAGKLYDYEHAVSAVRDPPWVRRDVDYEVLPDAQGVASAVAQATPPHPSPEYS